MPATGSQNTMKPERHDVWASTFFVRNARDVPRHDDAVTMRKL